MSEFWRRRVIGQLERGVPLEQIDRELRHIRSIDEDERAALWLLAWGEQHREKPLSGRLGRGQQDPVIDAGPLSSARSTTVDPIAAALELAQAETGMDVAVLGEVCDGREVVRFVAGAGSFGLAPGASMMIEDTYCHRLLTGRLSNIVPDTNADDQLRELPITHDARVGAYIGVPLTSIDARLYVLCCFGTRAEAPPEQTRRGLLTRSCRRDRRRTRAAPNAAHRRF